MKKLLAGASLAFAIAATPVVAEDLTPQMDVTVIQQDSAATAGGVFVPILFITLLLLLHHGGGGGSAIIIPGPTPA